MVAYNRVQAQRTLLANLKSRGYHTEMLKEEKGRYIDMYWHRDRVNADGDLAYKAGRKEVHQSTLKDNQDRMNVRGLTQAQVDEGYLSMLPWPPRATCNCRTCQETFKETPNECPLDLETLEPLLVPTHSIVEDGLCACGYKSEAPKKTSRKSAVYRHIQKEQLLSNQI